MGQGEHLLIDGYNVVHAWAETRRLVSRSLDTARNWLVERVRCVHDVDRIQTTLVFDGSGARVSFENPGNCETFCLVFAPEGVTADGIIEQMVRRSKLPQNCTVVSRDNLVGESIRASGAMLMPPDQLRDWVDRCERRQRANLRQQLHQNTKVWNEDSPWNALDSMSPK